MYPKYMLHSSPSAENALYVDALTLADQTILSWECIPEAKDNVRIYIPLELNRAAILRRLYDVYDRYGFLTEANESNIRREVSVLISQTEIYDQVWLERDGDCGNNHSQKATEVVKDMLAVLIEKEGCGETFPYEIIEELQREYGIGQNIARDE